MHGAEPRTWAQEAERASLLTPREIEVFFLLGAGSSNRSIATKLGITERTVKAHVARIMNKVGVESRLQAGLVAYAYQITAQDTTASESRPSGSVHEFGERPRNEDEYGETRCPAGGQACWADRVSGIRTRRQSEGKTERSANEATSKTMSNGA
ncbi:response regulator transcription factor [Streptomyces sp. NPDC058239]|uniref:response regulator transcription factor n=1 Tax=Streptomyces sp. NPDC058239 TaxID=3346395 RepID=UPI0036EF1FF9